MVVYLVFVFVYHCTMLCKISSGTAWHLIDSLVFIQLIWFEGRLSWMFMYYKRKIGIRCSFLRKIIDSLIIGWWRMRKFFFRSVTLLLTRCDTVAKRAINLTSNRGLNLISITFLHFIKVPANSTVLVL